MNHLLVAALALALVIAVLMLVRETKLRRALQKLLHIVLSNWRSNARNPSNDHADRRGSRPDDWLQ